MTRRAARCRSWRWAACSMTSKLWASSTGAGGRCSSPMAIGSITAPTETAKLSTVDTDGLTPAVASGLKKMTPIRSRVYVVDGFIVLQHAGGSELQLGFQQVEELARFGACSCQLGIDEVEHGVLSTRLVDHLVDLS